MQVAVRDFATSSIDLTISPLEVDLGQLGFQYAQREYFQTAKVSDLGIVLNQTTPLVQLSDKKSLAYSNEYILGRTQYEESSLNHLFFDTSASLQVITNSTFSLAGGVGLRLNLIDEEKYFYIQTGIESVQIYPKFTATPFFKVTLPEIILMPI